MGLHQMKRQRKRTASFARSQLEGMSAVALERLLRYAAVEAHVLGREQTAALIDAAVSSLRANGSDGPDAGGNRPIRVS